MMADVSSPLVVIVGRLSPEAKGVRGEVFAAGRGYFHGVVRAGGTPVLLPPIPEALDRIGHLLDRADAVVMHGGGDIDPRHYGQELAADEVYGIVPEHDEVELAVAREAIERDLPMLAICRGMQVVNVALGGTLVQHIGNERHWMQLHPVDVEADSHMAAAIGTTRFEACHSVHHQALDALGEGLRVVGRAPDGTLEAVEHTSARWLVAPQWHPEDTAATDPQQQALFDTLLAHC
jgi:putative glutamine amidotransferase